jgi:chemotaxis protein CheX
MELTHTDISQVLESIWESVLTREIQYSGTTATPSSEAVLAACIQITGAWNGAVTLHCSPELARQAAAAMFELEGDSVAREDMKDSLGELVNMVGGGVKSLLPATCVLSLPTVVEGVDFTISIPGASLVQQAAFESQGEPVFVTLLERDAV